MDREVCERKQCACIGFGCVAAECFIDHSCYHFEKCGCNEFGSCSADVYMTFPEGGALCIPGFYIMFGGGVSDGDGGPNLIGCPSCGGSGGGLAGGGGGGLPARVGC